MFDKSIILPIFIVAIIISVCVGLSYILFILREQQQLRRRVVEVMEGRRGGDELEQALIIAAPKRRTEQFLLRVIPTLQNFREKLRHARMDFSISIYVLVVSGVGLVGSFFVNLSPIPGALVPFLLTLVLHLFFDQGVLRLRMSYIRHKQLEQMPGALDLIVRSLRVGQPIDTCLQVCTQELQEPLGGDFARIVNRVSVGTPVSEAIDSVAYDAGVREFEFFATACRVQLEAGGNLADALQNLSETVRSRLTMRLKIEALAAEGKLSAWVIGALPFLLIAYLHFVNPVYIAPLFTTPVGKTMFAVAMILIFTGIIVMVRMIRIKI